MGLGGDSKYERLGFLNSKVVASGCVLATEGNWKPNAGFLLKYLFKNYCFHDLNF